MSAPRFTLVCHSPHVQSSNLDSMRTKCDGLEHIGAGTDSRVENDLHFCQVVRKFADRKRGE